MKTVLKRPSAMMLAAVMLIACAAGSVSAAAEEPVFFGKTEASVEKKTVPYITDFGEQFGGRKESW